MESSDWMGALQSVKSSAAGCPGSTGADQSESKISEEFGRRLSWQRRHRPISEELGCRLSTASIYHRTDCPVK